MLSSTAAVTFVLVLQTCVNYLAAQETYRWDPTVLSRETCVPEEGLARYAAERVETLAGIASEVTQESRGYTGCLESIYVLAYTSSLRNAQSNHQHNIELVVKNESKLIALPNRPGDYERHRGDIWKMSLSEDFEIHFCVRLCDIDKLIIVEGGINGWNIDSIVSFGCTGGRSKCTLITQDFDVRRWVDGDSRIPGRDRFPLTKVTNIRCAV